MAKRWAHMGIDAQVGPAFGHGLQRQQYAADPYKKHLARAQHRLDELLDGFRVHRAQGSR